MSSPMPTNPTYSFNFPGNLPLYFDFPLSLPLLSHNQFFEFSSPATRSVQGLEG